MPVTIGLVLGGAQVVGGLVQAFGSGKDAEQQRLEKLAKNSPIRAQSKATADYYNEALQRFKENPYQSAEYQMAAKEAQRATAAGTKALSGRMGGGAKLAGTSRLSLIQNDSMQRALSRAEGRKDQRFAQYGQAAQMKTNEENQLFDINQMTPYNRQLGLQQYKTQAANERYMAGLNMAAQGVGSAASIAASSAYANPKTAPVADVVNTNSYASGANPSAAYTNYMNFGKNPAGRYSAPKSYKPYGF
jgi:hypothetical protein